MPDGVFAGKVAVVTGGASGIGAASARRLAADGADVVVADLDVNAGRALADEIGGSFVVLDVADDGAWTALVADLERDAGCIDLAHLNAGIVTAADPIPFLDVPLERYRTVVGVNLHGVALGIRTLAPVMARGGGGSIVATASIAGVGPWGEDPIYSATKHAIVGLVRSVAPQLAERGIRVHAICPGAVATPLTDALHPERVERAGGLILDPAEVADAVAALLATDEAGLVQTIVHGRGAEAYEFRGVPGPRP